MSDMEGALRLVEGVLANTPRPNYNSGTKFDRRLISIKDTVPTPFLSFHCMSYL